MYCQMNEIKNSKKIYFNDTVRFEYLENYQVDSIKNEILDFIKDKKISSKQNFFGCDKVLEENFH